MVTLSVTPDDGLPAARSRSPWEAPLDVETGVPGDALERGKRWCPSGSRQTAASVRPSWSGLQIACSPASRGRGVMRPPNPQDLLFDVMYRRPF